MNMATVNNSAYRLLPGFESDFFWEWFEEVIYAEGMETWGAFRTPCSMTHARHTGFFAKYSLSVSGPTKSEDGGNNPCRQYCLL